MSLVEKIKMMDLDENKNVQLTYSEGCEVHHYLDEYLDMAMNETDVANELANAIGTGPLYESGNEVLDEMRADGLLDSYNRDFSGFEDYLAGVIRENWYDYDWIEHETERYDYKRGHTTLSFQFDVPIGVINESESYNFSGWSAAVETEHGILTVEG